MNFLCVVTLSVSFASFTVVVAAVSLSLLLLLVSVAEVGGVVASPSVSTVLLGAVTDSSGAVEKQREANGEDAITATGRAVVVDGEANNLIVAAEQHERTAPLWTRVVEREDVVACRINLLLAEIMLLVGCVVMKWGATYLLLV